MKLFTNDAIKNRIARRNSVRGIVNTIITVVLTPILIYNVLLIFQSIMNPYKTPSFLGIKTYVIISGSMTPELQIGDIVIVKNVKENEINEGDIISFRQGQNVITHRIAEKFEENGQIQYKTKGDNNNTEDNQAITYKTIEGKVIRKLPRVGNIVLALKNKMIIIIVAIILLMYFMQSEKVKSRRNKRRLKRLAYEKLRRKDE